MNMVTYAPRKDKPRFANHWGFRTAHICSRRTCGLDRAAVADTITDPKAAISDVLFQYQLVLSCPACRPVIIRWYRMFARRKFFQRREAKAIMAKEE
ncbi:MAG: hypothetical protein A2Y38_18200 [Spirochaetes bacterium GWB1_59_5]|nr:MAG: hypothetical protein A2Y38_18200 [Spirochaetes bacterium GWB1_59_5]